MSFALRYLFDDSDNRLGHRRFDTLEEAQKCAAKVKDILPKGTLVLVTCLLDEEDEQEEDEVSDEA